ncbi:MAG TPA: HAD family hydrolase [Candidatus Lokiarchaeia archaeon]|nr:HAD family hydrolase [Candidatus Lokiarchaeia archaeon]
MKITGYLLDIDGTLLDSKEAHTRAWQRTLEAHGIVKELGEIAFDFAAPDSDVVPELFGIDEVNSVEEITQEKNDFFIEELSAIPLFPNVPEVLARIHDIEGAICFVSSNLDRVIEGMLVAYGWDALDTRFVGLDGVTRAKPGSEMVIKALDKLGIEASGCVMIGDSTADVVAGRAAGIWTIAINSSGNSQAALVQVQPDLILGSIGELLPLLPLEFG